MTVDTILEALRELSGEERERVVRYIEHLRRFDDPQLLEGLADRIEILKADGGISEEQVKAILAARRVRAA